MDDHSFNFLIITSSTLCAIQIYEAFCISWIYQYVQSARSIFNQIKHYIFPHKGSRIAHLTIISQYTRPTQMYDLVCDCHWKISIK